MSRCPLPYIDSFAFLRKAHPPFLRFFVPSILCSFVPSQLHIFFISIEFKRMFSMQLWFYSTWHRSLEHNSNRLLAAKRSEIQFLCRIYPKLSNEPHRVEMADRFPKHFGQNDCFGRLYVSQIAQQRWQTTLWNMYNECMNATTVNKGKLNDIWSLSFERERKTTEAAAAFCRPPRIIYLGHLTMYKHTENSLFVVCGRVISGLYLVGTVHSSLILCGWHSGCFGGKCARM